MRKQAERFGAELVPETSPRWTSPPPESGQGRRPDLLRSRVIVATGSGTASSAFRRRGVLWRGTSWCATCDGFFFRDQDIAVSAAATALWRKQSSSPGSPAPVTVIHRRDQLRASKIMQERAFANEKISFLWNPEVAEVLGDTRVHAVRLRNRVTGEESALNSADCSSRSVTTPAWNSSRVTRPRRRGLPEGRLAHTRTNSPACSPAVTWSTTATVKPLPRREPDAPRPWTRNAT